MMAETREPMISSRIMGKMGVMGLMNGNPESRTFGNGGSVNSKSFLRVVHYRDALSRNPDTGCRRLRVPVVGVR